MEPTPGCSKVLSPVRLRPQRTPMSLNEKNVLLNVLKSISHNNPTNGIEQNVKETSKITGVSFRTVYRVLKEKRAGNVKEPKKTTGRTPIIVSDDVRTSIRRIVHSFFFQKHAPTLEKVHKIILEDDDLPNLSKTKLWRTLRNMNFKYARKDRKSILIEKDEIITWRRTYLRKIKEFREKGKRIYYQDETWINEGHTLSKVWQDKNIKSRRQAFLEGLSTGLPNVSGKGRRLIISHIGSDTGFVIDGLLLFQSKRTGDYHEDMNSAVFEKWFSGILKKLEPDSLIVLDNAPYHSRLLKSYNMTMATSMLILYILHCLIYILLISLNVFL